MFAVAGVVIGAVVGGVAGNYLDKRLNDSRMRTFLTELWKKANDSDGKPSIVIFIIYKL